MTDDNDDVVPQTQNQNPLHSHNPWQNEPGDPAEEDIDHVAFSPAPGVHFERTFIRSSPLQRNSGPRQQNVSDMMAPMFQSLSALFDGGTNPNGGPPRPGFAQAGLRMGIPHPFPPPHEHHHEPNQPGGPRSTTFMARMPRAGTDAQPIQNLHTVLATMLNSMQTSMNGNTQAPGGPPGNPFHIFAQLLNPANAAHGDAVYTEEALDRIISQMMEQNAGGGAPGPASAAAIAALPKKQVDKSMLGQDGKAECSICMNAVTIRDEVTFLPCNHWFHEDCVGAWLKEHDTCPHCRQGITPRDGAADTPRSPDQAPRHSQNPFGMPPGPVLGSRNPQMPDNLFQPGMTFPYVPGGYPAYPEPQDYVQPQHNSQRSTPQPSSPPPASIAHSRAQTPRRWSSTGVRGSPSSANSNGESNTSSTGVRGWFRSMRGSNGSSDRSA